MFSYKYSEANAESLNIAQCFPDPSSDQLNDAEHVSIEVAGTVLDPHADVFWLSITICHR